VAITEAKEGMISGRFRVSEDLVAEYCRRNHILRLAVFGSVLRGEARPESDIDILVEFEPAHVPGLMGIARMEDEMARVIFGRRVDLRTPEDLSHFFRDEVVGTAEPIYAKG